MADVAKLISAVAQVLWPIGTLIALLLFRADLSALLRRIRKGKIAGQEIELDEDVKELERVVERAAEQLPPSAASAAKQSEQSPQAFQEALTEAAKSPSLGLLALSVQIEKELIELATVLGYAGDAQPPNMRRVTEVLVAKGVLPSDLLRATDLFSAVRNRIAHGLEVDTRETTIALSAGFGLLRAIKSTPRQRTEILHAHVPFFSDSACTKQVPNATAVILQSYSPDGAKGAILVYPTTRTDYVPGSHVGWEWDMSKVFGESWYIHPATRERQYGWTSAAAFIGRPLDR